MKKRFRRLWALTMLFIVAALLITGYAGWLNPNTWSWFSLAGYAFPVALLLTVGALIICALMCKRLLPIPVIGLLLAYQPVTLYCPLHRAQQTPESTFTFLSYNTYSLGKGFHEPDDRTELHRQLIQYLINCKADIVCLQEASLSNCPDSLKECWPYADSIKGKGGSQVVIFSRYPILRKQQIDYDTKGNLTGAFWLNKDGREMIVINNHLQTMGFSMQERRDFGTMMHGERNESDYIKSTSRTILGKILDASCIRAHQADSVAAFMRRHSATPMIVCGDFNDIPQSNTYRTIANPGKGMDGEVMNITDCYRNTALGPGYSYSRFGMRVRIDNILCTEQLTPYNCKVDNSIDSSDHFPITCSFTLQ